MIQMWTHLKQAARAHIANEFRLFELSSIGVSLNYWLMQSNHNRTDSNESGIHLNLYIRSFASYLCIQTMYYGFFCFKCIEPFCIRLNRHADDGIMHQSLKPQMVLYCSFNFFYLLGLAELCVERAHRHKSLHLQLLFNCRGFSISIYLHIDVDCSCNTQLLCGPTSNQPWDANIQ